MGAADLGRQSSGDLLAALLLTESSGNQDHRVGRVAVDEFLEDPRHLIGADRHDKEIDLLRQSTDRRDAGDTVDFVEAGADDKGFRFGSNPPARMLRRMIRPMFMPLARDTDDGRGFGFEQVGDLGDGSCGDDGMGGAEDADAVEGSESRMGNGERVDLELEEFEVGKRVELRKVVGEADDRLEALDEHRRRRPAGSIRAWRRRAAGRTRSV